MLNIQIRPITKWPKEENKNPVYSPFSATYKQTLMLLEKELRMMGADKSSLIIEMWIDSRDLRLDGQLRASVKVTKQGIILCFNRKINKWNATEQRYVTKVQQLSYPCDAFNKWQENLRAIALSLERMRSVERYGVFKYDDIVNRLALPSAEGLVGTRRLDFFTQRKLVSMTAKRVSAKRAGELWAALQIPASVTRRMLEIIIPQSSLSI